MLKIETARYSRKFGKPLRTSSDCWEIREGIVLRVEDGEGRIGYGEIAPVKGFGGESLEEAQACLNGLGAIGAEKVWDKIPEEYGCTRFAMGSALWMQEEPNVEFKLSNCGLLPGGEAALNGLERLIGEGFLDFKLKIGLDTAEAEQALVEKLVAGLPEKGQLRLDANGGLTVESLKKWAQFLKGEARVGYLEQPLAPGHEREMARVMEGTGVLIALDESVTRVEAIETLDWRGGLVLKGALLGEPKGQIEQYGRLKNPLIFSSVFETGIGLYGGLRLAGRVQSSGAVGYGTLDYIEDGWNLFEHGPMLSSAGITLDKLEDIWKQICRK